MTATIINGKAMAQDILDGVRAQVEALGVPVQLAAVCAGGNPDLAAFVRLKQKSAQSVGVQFSSYFVDSSQQAEETLRYLATDPAVHGILLELPVPGDWDRVRLLSLIPPAKDVDALSPESEAAFEQGSAPVLPPAVIALRHVCDAFTIPLSGTHAAVIGAGQLVGRPISHWLRSQGATVDVLDIDTPQPQHITQQADLVVSGAGAPGLVLSDWIKSDAAVFDFGFHEGRGDVDADSVIQKAGLLARVPGGMGPIVVASVLENLLTLAMR